jgi:hypothetical protein
MPADFSDYVDLTTLDLSPTEVYLNAIQLGRIVLPEFEIRQGTPDDALLQAFSYMTALNVGAINRLPSRVMEGLCAIMGVQRSGGTRATVTITIGLTDYDDFTLPVDTVFTHTATTQLGNVTTSYELVSPVVVAASSPTDGSGNPNPLPTVTAQLTSTYTGVNPVVGVGDRFQIQNVNSQVDYAVGHSDFLNGQNPEDGTSFLNRATTYLQSLSANTATSNQIASYILSTFTTVSRAKVYDLTDPDLDETFGAAPVPGYASIYVYGVEQEMNQTQLYDILVEVANKSTAGLSFSVKNFTPVNVGITCEIVYDGAYTEQVIIAAVKAELADFLSITGFDSRSERVKVSEVTSKIAAVPGVFYVQSVTISDVDNLASAPAPIISLDSATGDIVFLKKGLLATSSDTNFNVTATPD